MKKNSQLHISLGTELLVFLQLEAEEKGLCLSEYCRQKLRENFYFEDMKSMLNKLLEKNGIK